MEWACEEERAESDSDEKPSYDFFKKLEIAHCIGKIPKSLFHNISKLNDLRVTVAQNPDYDLTKMDVYRSKSNRPVLRQLLAQT